MRYTIIEDPNIYQCPACGSKRVSPDPRSHDENVKHASYIAIIFIALGLFIWLWLIPIGIILAAILAASAPLKLRCYSCHRRWRRDQVKIIGQVKSSRGG